MQGLALTTVGTGSTEGGLAFSDGAQVYRPASESEDAALKSRAPGIQDEDAALKNRAPQTQDPEEALLRRCLAGDWSEYGQLVERYQRLAWAAVDAVTLDKSQVPDLVQESFVRAYEKLHLYEFRSSFASWLYRVARNVALSAGRSRARRPVQLIGENAQMEQAGTGRSGQSGGPAEAYLDSARGTALRTLLAELPEQYHEPLALYYFNDMNYEQISQALGLPLNTVRTHLRRARLRLLELAQQQGWDGGANDG